MAALAGPQKPITKELSAVARLAVMNAPFLGNWVALAALLDNLSAEIEVALAERAARKDCLVVQVIAA